MGFMATLLCRRHVRVPPVPALVPVADRSGPKPWKISFSYGRALQDPALEAWCGRDDILKADQRALRHRASLNRAASLGNYTDEMERASPTADDGRDWRDD
jgi:Fructose-bisphosphate aldolase class-I